MAFVVTAGTDGVYFWADEATPTTPADPSAVTPEGAKALFSFGKWLEEHTTVLDAITDAGGGVIPTAAQLGNIHVHSQLAVLETIPTPTAGQSTGYMLAPTGPGTYGIILAPASPASPTNYRGGLVGNADLTGNSTGNTYLDGGVDMLAGDLFVVTSNGTLTTNTGTNIAVSSGDHVYIETTTTDSTIVDANLDVTTPASGVTSIDFGGGIQTGPVTVDLDDIADGSTYVKATQAELDAIATNTTNITGLGTSKLNQSVWDAYAGRTITSAGRNAVITTAEAAAIAALESAGTTGQILKRTGTGAAAYGWDDESGGAGTVTSVNGETPTAGNVVNTLEHVADSVGADRFAVTALQLANIATALANAAAVSSAMARWQNTEPLTISVGGTTAWDVVDAIRGTLTLSGNTTLAFPSNLNIDAGKIKEPYLQLLVTQVGGFTLTLSTANGYYPSSGLAYVASTAPNAVDVITFTAAPGSTTKLLYTVAPNYSP